MYNCIKLVFLFVAFSLAQIANGQKQEVQIVFKIDVDDLSSFSLKFGQVMDQLAGEAIPVFIQHFNEYVSYINFTEEDRSKKLIITLTHVTRDNSIDFSNYSLTFAHVDGSGVDKEFDWDWLTSTKVASMRNNQVGDFIKTLDNDLPGHLIEQHNITYTKELFNKLPIIVPDTSYYFITEENNFMVILPVERNELNLDISNADIKAKLYGIDSSNDIIPSEKQPVIYIKDSREKHIGKCMTGYINTDVLGFTKFAHAEIFIEDYDYQPCLDCAAPPGEFFVSNN